MSEKAKKFSIGGAELLEMNTVNAVTPLSGASKEEIEKNTVPLTPMNDHAQAVEKLSGAQMVDLKKIYFNESF